MPKINIYVRTSTCQCDLARMISIGYVRDDETLSDQCGLYSMNPANNPSSEVVSICDWIAGSALALFQQVTSPPLLC